MKCYYKLCAVIKVDDSNQKGTMMCKQRKWSTSVSSFDLVSLLVISVAFVSAHVVITRLVVPDLAVMSTEVCVGHTYLG